MSLANRVRRDLRKLSGLADLVAKERRSLGKLDLPWSRRLALWRAGFLSESDVLLDLAHVDRRL